LEQGHHFMTIILEIGDYVTWKFARFQVICFLNLLCYIGLDFLVFFFLFWRGRGVP
jgi:hypothetical protein